MVRAGLDAGVEVEVEFRDGQVVLEPATVPMRVIRRGQRSTTIESEREMPPLTSADVRAVLERRASLNVVDTSVVVAAALPWHESHGAARSALSRTKAALLAQVAVETYSVLTRLPPPSRVPASVAREYLGETFALPPLVLAPDGYLRLLDLAAAESIAGGALYDALVGATARKPGRRCSRSTGERRQPIDCWTSTTDSSPEVGAPERLLTPGKRVRLAAPNTVRELLERLRDWTARQIP
jgi:predicted nucleic acid-binding protein